MNQGAGGAEHAQGSYEGKRITSVWVTTTYSNIPLVCLIYHLPGGVFMESSCKAPTHLTLLEGLQHHGESLRYPEHSQSYANPEVGPYRH